MTAHSAFIGDRTYPLRLGRNEILSLEEKQGRGIGTIWRNVLSGDFAHADLTETIRLGLVGAGMAPQAAQILTERDVATRPYAELLPIAIGTLELLFVGAPACSHPNVGSEQ